MVEEPSESFHELVAWSEGYLERYGEDGPRSVGILKGDADVRYRVMLDVIRAQAGPVSLLDVGCGLAGLNDLIVREGRHGITYAGLDLSPRFLEAARAKYPDSAFYRVDVLTDGIDELPAWDYVVANGIVHYKGGQRSDDDMWAYLRALIRRLFSKARIGLAINMVSRQVEWERDDLFHVPADRLLGFLSTEVSRHVVLRHDYGLFEQTAYVYRTPSDPDVADAKPLIRRRDPRPPEPPAPSG